MRTLPLANQTHLPVAFKNGRLHVLQVQGVKFLPRRLEHIRSCDEGGGQLPVVELAVFIDFSFDSNRE